MRRRDLFLVLLAFIIAEQAFTQEVTPRLNLGGRGIVSFNYESFRGKDLIEKSSALNDFSDSGILLGVKHILYNQGRGEFVLGFQFPDAVSDLGQVFFHQVHVTFQNRWLDFKIGR